MSPATGEQFEHDAFISYSHLDSDWVWNKLIPFLRAARLKVCADRDCFDLGSPTVRAIEHAIRRSRKTILVLSPDYVASEWCEFEGLLTQTLDPAARRRILLPVLLKNCELPLRIRMLAYLDLTRLENTDGALERLVLFIRSDVPASEPAGDLFVRADLGLLEHPVLLFEGVFGSAETASIAFTIFNASDPILVLSSVDFLSVVFKLIKRPNVMRFYAGVRRTGLSVDLVKAGEQSTKFRSLISVPYSDSVMQADIRLGTPGWTSRFENEFSESGFSVLPEDMAFHIPLQSAESLSLNVKGEVDDPQQFGFLSFFLLRTEIARPASPNHSRAVLIDQLFECSRNPRGGALGINLHRLDLVKPVTDIFLGNAYSLEAHRQVLSAARTEQFSDAFLYEFAHRIEQAPEPEREDTIDVFLELASRMCEKWHDSVLWVPALKRVLSRSSISSRRRHDPNLMKLFETSAYPTGVRLMAARVLTGLTPLVPAFEGHTRSTTEDISGTTPPIAADTLSRFCASVLDEALPSRKTEWYERDRAIETRSMRCLPSKSYGGRTHADTSCRT